VGIYYAADSKSFKIFSKSNNSGLVLREDRKKASDVFRETNYVFSKKAPFEEVFPQIDEISVIVEERVGSADRNSRKRHYNKKNISEYVDCSNPLCYNGGVSIGSIIRSMVIEKQTHNKTTKLCQGYEGSPKGRKKYRDCLHMFDVEVDIKYKSES